MSTLEWIILAGVGYWVYTTQGGTGQKAHLNPSRVQPGAAENLAQVSGFNYSDLVQTVQQYGISDQNVVAPGSTVGLITQVAQSQLPASSTVSNGRLNVTVGVGNQQIGPVQP